MSALDIQFFVFILSPSIGENIMTDTNQSLEQLNALCKGKDWFCEAGTDEHGRLVAYVKSMSMDVLTSIPSKIADKQVLVHFATNKNLVKETMGLVKETEEELNEDDFIPDLDFLIAELDRLEKMCGSHILEDIFYETNDQKNAITNLSAKFPDVRDGMDKLYDTYGFDLIYESLSGSLGIL